MNKISVLLLDIGEQKFEFFSGLISSRFFSFFKQTSFIRKTHVSKSLKKILEIAAKLESSLNDKSSDPCFRVFLSHQPNDAVRNIKKLNPNDILVVPIKKTALEAKHIFDIWKKRTQLADIKTPLLLVTTGTAEEFNSSFSDRLIQLVRDARTKSFIVKSETARFVTQDS